MHNIKKQKNILQSAIKMALASSCCLMAALTTPYSHADIFLEAETGTLDGVEVSTSRPGYSGQGYVTGFNASGDTLDIVFNSTGAGSKALYITYAANKTQKNKVYINGTLLGQIELPASSSFTELAIGSGDLIAGINTISIEKDWGWIDVDKVRFAGVSANVRLEAENAVLNGVSVATTTSGYSGSGYITNFATAGDNVKFSVYSQNGGSFALKVGYGATANRLARIMVNGARLAFATTKTSTTTDCDNITSSTTSPVYDDFNFPGSAGALAEITIANISLNAGHNSVEIHRRTGAMELDYIQLDNVSVGPSAWFEGNQEQLDVDGNGFETFALDASQSTSSNGSISDYTWYVDGISIGSGASINANLALGQHQVELVITDSQGATARISRQANVRALYTGLLSDPDATPETRNLFLKLESLKGLSTIFGQHLSTTESQVLDHGVDPRNSDTQAIVNDFVGLHGFDFGRGVTKHMEYAIKSFEAGGVITYSWHADNPVTINDSDPLTSGNDKDTLGYPLKELLPGGSGNAQWTAWLDELADNFFNVIQGELNGQTVKVPVIFRPFHENTGSWFWWGDDWGTAQDYKNAFRYTIDYLRNVKGVHNMLVAFSPSKPSQLASSGKSYGDWYPGDDYVDIIGYDMYGKYSTAAEKSEFQINLAANNAIVADFAEADLGSDQTRRKIAMISETGVSKGIQNASYDETWFSQVLLDSLNNDPTGKGQKVVAALTWMNNSATTCGVTAPSSYWIPVNGQAHDQDFIDFYDDSRTAFESDLSNMYNYNGHSYCSSASFDIDGDGWGWENSASCKVITE